MRPGETPRDVVLPVAAIRQQGFTLIAVLILLALVSLGLAAAGPAWSVQSQREHEDELLRVGTLYARAIAEYRDNSPGSVKSYPDQLSWLVNDTRFVGITHHMRKLYPDPMNPGKSWGLVKDDAGHITGVYSLSDKTPLRQQKLDLGDLELAAAQHYSDWKFKPKPPIVAQPPGASPPQNSSKAIQ